LTARDVRFVSRRQAKRYIARVDAAGEIVVTLPPGGTRMEALRFVNRHRDWLEGQRQEALRRARRRRLRSGDWLWYRGERTRVERVERRGRHFAVFGDQVAPLGPGSTSLDQAVKERLVALAQEELPDRVWQLARMLKLKVSRVTVRDQKTRWGSCSSAGTISLNWRLLQTPPATCDYILIHELMHLREMNHSDRFWRLVGQACPDYRTQEAWLLLRQDELDWTRSR